MKSRDHLYLCCAQQKKKKALFRFTIVLPPMDEMGCSGCGLQLSLEAPARWDALTGHNSLSPPKKIILIYLGVVVTRLFMLPFEELIYIFTCSDHDPTVDTQSEKERIGGDEHKINMLFCAGFIPTPLHILCS